MPYEQSMIAAFRSMGLRLAQRRQMRHAFTIGDVIDGQLLVSEDESVSIQLEGRHVDLERALEICLLSGRPQSGLRRSFVPIEPKVNGVILTWDRETLYRRINQRTLDMFGAGLIAEVSSLGPLSPTAEKAIGVREVRAHLAGQVSLADTTAAIQQATRHYAKRQMTWFRRERCFQTICLDSLPAAQYTLPHLLELFPCLRPSSPSAPFSSI